MKKVKVPKVAHTSDSKYGRGDFYGSGVKNPVGKIIDVSTVKPMTSKKLGKPPKSLA